MNKFMSMVFAVILLTGMLSGCFQSADPNLASQPSTTAPAGVPTQIKTQPTTVSATEPTQIKNQPTTVPTQPEDPGIELESQISKIDIFELSRHAISEVYEVKWPIMIKSNEELQEFANTDFAVKCVQNFQPFLDYFNDAFFTENTLILVCLYTQPCHHNQQVQSCLKKQDGSYMITLEKCKFGWGDDMPYFVLNFIEVKDDIPKDAVIQFRILDPYAELITN